MVEFWTFMGSWPWSWPWIPIKVVPLCISHRALPVYQISSKSKKLFVDGRTYGRTDGNLTPVLLGRLPKFGIRLKRETIIPHRCIHENGRCCWNGFVTISRDDDDELQAIKAIMQENSRAGITRLKALTDSLLSSRNYSNTVEHSKKIASGLRILTKDCIAGRGGFFSRGTI